MPKGNLPGFVWDARRQVYRRLQANGIVGDVVGRDEIVAVLGTLAERSERMLGDLVVALLEGEITERDAYLAGRILLKDLYNANSALARGGWNGMDAQAWGRNGQILRGEYVHWRDFCAEIAAGNFSEAQVRARAALYVGKAYSRFWAEDRLLKLAGGDYRWEEWLDVGDERECGDCPELAALGRVPLGTLATVPGAGDTACGGNCRCVIVYS